MSIPFGDNAFVDTLNILMLRAGIEPAQDDSINI